MRLRYLVGIWILGALIVGFSLGQIVERRALLQALSNRLHETRHRDALAPDAPSRDEAAAILARA